VTLGLLLTVLAFSVERTPVDAGLAWSVDAGRPQADGGTVVAALAGPDGGVSLDAGAHPPTPDEAEAAAKRGWKVYRARECGACHSTDGSDGTAPTLLGLWGKTVKLKGGESVVADEAYLRESILLPGAKLVDGYPPLMQPLAEPLTPEEVDLLLAYLRALADDEEGFSPP
jgi:mono/diheme cytochrome c family protein